MRRGATAIEAVAVLAIVGLAAALLLPSVQTTREVARTVTCTDNLRQIGAAIAMYHDVHGVYPPGRLGGDMARKLSCTKGQTDVEATAASAFVLLLPQMGAADLYAKAHMDDMGIWNASPDSDYRVLWRDADRLRFIEARPSFYVCPTSRAEPVYAPQGSGDANLSAATGDYALNMGHYGPRWGFGERVKCMNSGPFVYRFTRSADDVSDGLSNTFFVGEVVAGHQFESKNVWSYASRLNSSLRSSETPLNTPPGEGRYFVPTRSNGAFGSDHAGGANFVFGDGRVEFIADAVDPYVYQAQSTIHWAERLSDDSAE